MAPVIDIALGGEYQQAWGVIEEAVRAGACGFELRHGTGWIEHMERHPDRRVVFARTMTSGTRAVEQAILDSHDFGRFALAVDIGGSHANLIGGLLQQHAQARGIVFDLPGTVEEGHAGWKDAPFADRLQAVGGNFFESVPQADLYLLKSILHDWRDTEALAILQTIRRAIQPGGRVAIIENVLPDDGSAHRGWGSDVTMMMITGGRERTRAEYARLLGDAGFEEIGCFATSSTFSVIEARAVVL
jgi:hypothetical protein